MSIVHVLFENESWMPPLREALVARGLTVHEHEVSGGHVDLGTVPPEGVFINRMSPSAHTRDHQGGVVFLQQYLAHLEAHGRRVINGTRAFALEVSKVAQDLALRGAGIRTPRTIAVVGGPAALKRAARGMDFPFITKHNQGGKGLGVRLFRDLEAFDAYVDGPEFEQSPDGVTLLQQYIKPAEPFITRVEIVDGIFQYAIRSSTEDGFELCPADACAVGDAHCPVGEGADSAKFALREDIKADDPLVEAYVRLMREHHIDIAGIEFVEDERGHRYTYDINGTTNYNGDVEEAHGLSGMGALARLVETQLRTGQSRLAA
jgi:glutathione synthase/RimK-type ligase-like ATP-grasp enzyme